MRYDVFISYSRKDSEVANRVCAAFDCAGISYFIDRQGISGGFEFPTVIAEAIIESSVVLFLASKNSYESKFTNAELTFAFNEKPKNSVLPYIIDGTTMPAAMRFVFSNINWRTMESHPIDTILVDDVLRLLGRCRRAVAETNTTKRTTSATTAPAPTITPSALHNETIYKVGDIYYDGRKRGVVFDVWDGGRHGKIVSLEQTILPWCSSKMIKSVVEVGAFSEDDGRDNTNKVISLSNRVDYPAFMWCRSKGEEWYMPAVNELKLLLSDNVVRDALDKACAPFYWTSTEWNDYGAMCVRSGLNTRNEDKQSYGSVYAVATF